MGGLLNQHRPHYRLPAEILSHIFLLLSTRDDWKHTPGYSAWGPRFTGGQPRELVPLTAVCQRWRSILLGTPLLWSTVQDSDDDRAPPFANYIHRCTHGPLYVRMYAQPHSITRDLLAHHSERVQDLSVRNYEGDGLGFPDIITSFKGNELRRCEFHLRDDQYTGPPFQTFFHHGYAPQLRTLQLASSPYLPRNRFPTLTHFILECSQVASYTFQDLQEFLSGCPALQVLHLSMASTSNMQAPSTPSATPRGSLHFRHLRRLSVIDAPLYLGDDYYFEPGPTAAVIARRGALPQVLLSSMVFPPQCLLYTSPLPSGNIQPFADHMSTLLTPSSMRIVDAKQSYVAPSKSEQISFVLVQPSESRGVRYDVPFVSYNQREASSVKQDVLRVIATSPLFSAIRELWADTGFMYFLGGKDSILWSLPRLEYISLCCAREEKFALHSLLEVLSTVQEGSLVCPELDTLVLITYLPLKPLIARLRSILVVRKDSGHPLKHLAVYVDLEGVSRKVLEEARGLGDLVEHFFLNDNEDVPESEWERFWDERVPAGCGVVDEIHDHWPVWVERVDPLDK